MRHASPRLAAALFAAACLLARPAAAGDPKKDMLVADPDVRRSLEPGNNQLGRNVPNQLPAETQVALQQAIDRSHHGSTGLTKPNGGTRQPPDQAPELRDGEAPRKTEQPR
ncbi:MAG TPA: hypothetical protein VIL65_07595 [Beijerinckiaceae bacterium]|jgi:hypothetical protein